MENVIHWVEHKDDSPLREVHHLPPDPTANRAIRNMEYEERKKQREMKKKKQKQKAEDTGQQKQKEPVSRRKAKRRKRSHVRVWRAER